MNIKNFFVALSIPFILMGCKKSDTATPATVTTSNSVTATVNGQNFNGNVTWSANGGGGYISLGGQTASQKPYSSMSFQFIKGQYGKPGTYTITKSGFNQDNSKINSYYTDDSGNSFKATLGTINVTQADTGKYGFINLEATFSFSTDTINGKSNTVSNGKIIYHHN